MMPIILTNRVGQIGDYYPTCYDEERVQINGRIEFTSDTNSFLAGLRPFTSAASEEQWPTGGRMGVALEWFESSTDPQFLTFYVEWSELTNTLTILDEDADSRNCDGISTTRVNVYSVLTATLFNEYIEQIVGELP